MFNITRYSTTHRSVVWFFLVVMLLGGVYAFMSLGKREDSTFVIKSAVVTCPYAGATPEEVERLVAVPLERELRTLSSVHQITSESHFGYASLMVELAPDTPVERIPQLWDELRRKIDNVAPRLPEGVGRISVADDFGDVYGLYYALSMSEGYTWDELRTIARDIERKLYTVSGVEKVQLWGEPETEVNITISPSTLAAFDLRPDAIRQAVSEQNAVVGLGVRCAGDVRIELVEGTTYTSLADIENQLLIASDGKQYRLGDVATIERGYVEPRRQIVRVDGSDAIAIAVATDPSQDIVAVGDAVEVLLDEVEQNLPVGINLVALYPENEIAREANNMFLLNLVESLAIVVLLIVVWMGLRSGVVVGVSLVACIGGTLLAMLLIGEGLNRTSLAGFIIAMGMLVDNAIVVVDNTQRLVRSGVSLREAVVRGASEPRMALLAATLIAIISFLPLQLAPSSVAEIIQPLFVVVAISLMLSWLLALTQVPAITLELGVTSRESGSASRRFKSFVSLLMRFRWLTVATVVALFALSLWAMGRMPQNFFPQLSKPYFRADVLLADGYDIEATSSELDSMSRWLLAQPEVKRVSTTAGGTPPRYYLASGSYADRPNYGNILVELYDEATTADVEDRFDRWVAESRAGVWLRSSLFRLSPVPDATIEFGFVGSSIDTLQMLTRQALDLMRRRADVRNVRNSWGNRVAVWQPRYSQIKAQRIGVGRESMIASLAVATSGLQIGSYREQELSMPILLRSTSLVDSALSSLETMPVFSQRGNAYSIEQASSGFDFSFMLPVIKRVNAERVMKAQCDPQRGVNAISLMRSLDKELTSAVELPEGYRMEIFGEEEDREESNAALGEWLPATLILIFVILLLLFGNYRDPIAVMLTIPLIFVGVVFGLLLTQKLFDFFSLLGLLGLIGMNVKNAVILISRIGELRDDGVSPYAAVVEAAADRFRPVIAASATTVLGMLPLLFDSMFGAMAATIMGGLIVATLLVLVVLPVVYSIVYRIKVS